MNKNNYYEITWGFNNIYNTKKILGIKIKKNNNNLLKDNLLEKNLEINSNNYSSFLLNNDLDEFYLTPTNNQGNSGTSHILCVSNDGSNKKLLVAYGGNGSSDSTSEAFSYFLTFLVNKYIIAVNNNNITEILNLITYLIYCFNFIIEIRNLTTNLDIIDSILFPRWQINVTGNKIDITTLKSNDGSSKYNALDSNQQMTLALLKLYIFNIKQKDNKKKYLCLYKFGQKINSILLPELINLTNQKFIDYYNINFDGKDKNINDILERILCIFTYNVTNGLAGYTRDKLEDAKSYKQNGMFSPPSDNIINSGKYSYNNYISFSSGTINSKSSIDPLTLFWNKPGAWYPKDEDMYKKGGCISGPKPPTKHDFDCTKEGVEFPVKYTFQDSSNLQYDFKPLIIPKYNFEIEDINPENNEYSGIKNFKVTKPGYGIFRSTLYFNFGNPCLGTPQTNPPDGYCGSYPSVGHNIKSNIDENKATGNSLIDKIYIDYVHPTLYLFIYEYYKLKFGSGFNIIDLEYNESNQKSPNNKFQLNKIINEARSNLYLPFFSTNVYALINYFDFIYDIFYDVSGNLNIYNIKNIVLNKGDRGFANMSRLTYQLTELIIFYNDKCKLFNFLSNSGKQYMNEIFNTSINGPNIDKNFVSTFKKENPGKNPEDIFYKKILDIYNGLYQIEILIDKDNGLSLYNDKDHFINSYYITNGGLINKYGGSAGGYYRFILYFIGLELNLLDKKNRTNKVNQWFIENLNLSNIVRINKTFEPEFKFNSLPSDLDNYYNLNNTENANKFMNYFNNGPWNLNGPIWKDDTGAYFDFSMMILHLSVFFLYNGMTQLN